MSEITVKTQKELDAIPVDFTGIIRIEFGTAEQPAVLSNKYPNASVVACGSASVWAYGSASVVAYGTAIVRAYGSASVEAYGSASVEAWGSASVVACGSASVRACGSASVWAYGTASVWAYGTASVEAYDSASVVASGFAQIVKISSGAKTAIRDMARCIEPTADIDTFCIYHGIKRDGEGSVWYKAVHRDGGRYIADYDKSFTYEIGAEKSVEWLDTDRNEDCGMGIHIATLPWALDYGKDWDDLAILEVRAKTADIVLPYASDGKVRVDRVKVIREVPLEECGIYGKMLAERRNKHET